MTAPLQDVLLVGFGAVGAVCESEAVGHNIGALADSSPLLGTRLLDPQTQRTRASDRRRSFELRDRST